MSEERALSITHVSKRVNTYYEERDKESDGDIGNPGSEEENDESVYRVH